MADKPELIESFAWAFGAIQEARSEVDKLPKNLGLGLLAEVEEVRQSLYGDIDRATRRAENTARRLRRLAVDLNALLAAPTPTTDD